MKDKNKSGNEKGLPIFSSKQNQIKVENLDLGAGERRERIANIALILIIIVLITIILKNLGSVFKPLIVSLFVLLTILPGVKILNRKLKIPRSIGFVIMFLLIVLIFYFSGILINTNLSSFSEKLPLYETKINNFLKYINETYNIYPGQTLTFNELIKLIPRSTYSDLIGLTANLFYDLVTFLIYIIILSAFILMEMKNFDLRVLKAFGKTRSNEAKKVYNNITYNINKYIISKLICNLGTALNVGLIGIFFKIDFLVLWMYILFLMNWIPYIGNIIGLAPPILLCFLQYPTTLEPVLFSVLSITAAVIWGNIIEPKLFGKTLNISPILVILSMTFFGWLWGIVGIILSVPIVVSIKLIFENFQSTKSIGILMSEAIDEEDQKNLLT